MSYRPDTYIVPIGAVLPWFGSISGCPSLPDGWQVCDGSAINDVRSPLYGQTTPQLNSGTHRIIRGSTSSGSVGGEDTHQLTESELPSHSHNVTDNGHSHGVTDPGHFHGTGETFVYSNPGGPPTTRSAAGAVTWDVKTIPSKVTGLTVNNGAADIVEDAIGSDSAHNNLPGYTEAIFIIRIF